MSSFNTALPGQEWGAWSPVCYVSNVGSSSVQDCTPRTLHTANIAHCQHCTLPTLHTANIAHCQHCTHNTLRTQHSTSRSRTRMHGLGAGRPVQSEGPAG